MDDLLIIPDEVEEVEAIDEVLQINDELYPRNKIYLEHKNPFELYTDVQFRKIYRMQKETAQYIIGIVRDDLTPLHGNKGRPVNADLQVLATIRYFAKGAYETDIADLHGFNQSTLSRIIKRVVESIAQHRQRFIYLPRNEEERHRVKQDFYAIAECPNVVGAIDCTHAKIKCPGGEYPLMYMNRKGYYSLNVQVVGDAKCKIQDIVARWRGSAHDSRIWEQCVLKAQFANGNINGILLGDSGYPCTHYLLTPLLNPVTEADRRYNRCHIRTRNTVERLFGNLKNKFRCFFNGLQINLDTAKAAIIALAIIHNICIDMEGIEVDSDDEEDGGNNDNIVMPDDVRGAAFRRQYIDAHFAN